MSPVLELPPLAGLCSRADALRPGLDVEACAAILHRLAYAAQRLAILAAAWLPSSPEWELKQALALHGWIDAERAERIHRRIAEMREPPPGMHDVPDPHLEWLFDEAQAATASADRIAALYGVLRPAFLAAVRAYLDESHALADQPSRRLLRGIEQEEQREILPWSTASLGVAAATATDRADRVRAWLQAAGGIDGRSTRATPPGRTAPARYEADILPRRDARFGGLFDTSTPADAAYLDESRPADERNAALLFKRVREMDVPEVIAGIIAERWMAARNAARDGRPPGGPDWTYFTNMCRQMWDEARHAMLGETLLEQRGLEWRRLPINATFSYKLARWCAPVERHILLYAIEQSLMPRTTGKPYEHRVAAESGDALSRLFHDFDWADEVLHVEIARRCLRPELPGGLGEARDRADALWRRVAEALEREPLPESDPAPPNWWPEYVKAITGRDPAPLPDTHVRDWRPTS
jgi:hypothetical protein